MTTSFQEAVSEIHNAIERGAKAVVAPLANAYGRGYVAGYDRATRKASIRKDSRTAEPTSGFDVPPTFELATDDYVAFRELGADRLVLHPLDRNANADWNPLTAAGQFIIGGEDGAPTALATPADPSSDYTLEWDGASQAPVWVEKP